MSKLFLKKKKKQEVEIVVLSLVWYPLTEWVNIISR